jgi:putative membrane protein
MGPFHDGRVDTSIGTSHFETMNFQLNGVLFFLHWIVSAVALLLTSKIIKGFEVRNFLVAMIAAVVIGFCNAIIWPVLIFLTLPINIITLGLFTFVVNGAVLKISAALMPGFAIKSWLGAIFGAIMLSLLNLLLHRLLV